MTTLHRGEFQQLETELQQQLVLNIPDAQEIEVRCGLWRGKLVVLGQHSPDYAPKIKPTLALIMKLVQQSWDRGAIDQSLTPLPVQLALRIEGRDRPYAAHRFVLRSPFPVQATQPQSAVESQAIPVPRTPGKPQASVVPQASVKSPAPVIPPVVQPPTVVPQSSTPQAPAASSAPVGVSGIVEPAAEETSPIVVEPPLAELPFTTDSTSSVERPVVVEPPPIAPPPETPEPNFVRSPVSVEPQNEPQARIFVEAQIPVADQEESELQPEGFQLDEETPVSVPTAPPVLVLVRDPGNADEPDAAYLDEDLLPEPLLSSSDRTWVTLLQPRRVLTTAAVLLTLGGATYALTRPCVIGGCAPLETADRLGQEAMQTVQKPRSPQEVNEAFDKLTEANYLLEQIPPWSRFHGTAQQQMDRYEAQANVLEKVVVAQKQAIAASLKSQKPPHPLPLWREVQLMWREAIASLQEVPKASPVRPLAETKIQEYQTNLETVNKYIVAEQQAQQRINAARTAASTAETRASTAASVQAWQNAQATWQVAVNQLQQVSRNTMAYAEVQQLLALYLPQLASVGDRLKQETVASATLSDALKIATEAQRLERNNQWQRAVTQWQAALGRVQQVSNGTSYFSQAQPLIASYRVALTNAQSRLQTNVGMQSAQANLEQTCSGSPRACTLTRDGDILQVRITAAYQQAAQQTMPGAPASGNAASGASVAYLNPLLRAVASVGESANLPIELYNADGSLFGTYEPELDGYVPVRAKAVALGGNNSRPAN